MAHILVRLAISSGKCTSVNSSSALGLKTSCTGSTTASPWTMLRRRSNGQRRLKRAGKIILCTESVLWPSGLWRRAGGLSAGWTRFRNGIPVPIRGRCVLRGGLIRRIGIMVQVGGDPSVADQYDWVDDDSMSADETLRRFEALNPQPTTGPAPAPTPDEFMASRAHTYALSTTTRVVRQGAVSNNVTANTP